VRSRPRLNLTFHGVGERARSADGGEERVWLDLDSFGSVLDSVVDRPYVGITFDDGNASDVVYALPALRRRGLKATFFVVAGRLGAPGFLDETGVRTLLDCGMSIGCHGMRHRPWRRLDDEALREELLVARKVLEAIVEGPVTEAACPFGSYDRRALRSLRRYGYERVFTSDRGLTRPDAWLQPRNTVERGGAAETVDYILASQKRSSGAFLLQQPRLVAKRWR
jgi:peptidoglycan/xylan/chitin deacetylase (PgdA/CDA1 family)